MAQAEELEGLIRPVVENAGLELVEVAYSGGRGRGILRVTVDREGGVDLDSVAEASERISRRLDLEGFDPGPYTLEVTSPGVERQLRRPEDFSRRVGAKVRVRTVEGQPDERVVIGRIASASEDGVVIETERGERSVPYGAIAHARTVFEWPDAAGGRAPGRGAQPPGGRRPAGRGSGQREDEEGDER